MLFYNDECKCLHLEQDNAKVNFLMNKSVFLSMGRETYLGVIVRSDMKVSDQSIFAARKESINWA